MDTRALFTRAFAAATLAWAALLPAAAFAAAHGAGSWASPIVVAAYAAGHVVCHQRPERSFHAWGVQLPVCARCFGVYAGGALAAGAAHVLPLRRRRAIAPLAVLAVAAAPSAATFVYEWTVGRPGNLVRAAAGLPLGLAVVALVLQQARDEAEVN
jgi:uncharacterized membrane protein